MEIIVGSRYYEGESDDDLPFAIQRKSRVCFPSGAARDREPLVLLVRDLLLVTHKKFAVLLETNSELNRRVAFVAAENCELFE